MTPQEQIQQLESRIVQLESRLNAFDFRDRFNFSKPIHAETGVGLRLLTSTSEKLGFFGKTPATQYTIALNGSAGATYGGTEQNMLNAHNDIFIRYGLAHA